MSFHPSAGQIALIEPEEFGCAGPDRAIPLTGIVDVGTSEVLTLIGVSSPDLADGSEVIVSIFAPEALYRIRAAAHWGPSGRLAIDPIHDLERIERRSWPRHALRINVTLAALDGPDVDLVGVAGRTLDLGVAGLRVETIGCLPAGADVTVMLTLPDGGRLVARTTVVSAEVSDSGCEYRLAFDCLNDVDTGRLMALVGPEAGPGPALEPVLTEAS
jgi:PilZ domain